MYNFRKPLSTGRPEPSGVAGGASARGVGSSAYGNGIGGDFYRGIDRPGSGLGGAAGGAGGAGGDYFRQSGAGQSAYGRPGLGLGGKSGDSQSSFAQDAIFF